MKTRIKFEGQGGCIAAINCRLTFENPTAEQLERLYSLDFHIQENLYINVPPALIVLLGVDPQTTVTVPPNSFKKFFSLVDPGAPEPYLKPTPDEGAIIRAWLDAGAPLEWDPADPVNIQQNRAKLARDAAGRFCRITPPVS